MGISFLTDPQKYIGIGVHRFYGGKEDTIRIFSWYTLMDTLGPRKLLVQVTSKKFWVCVANVKILAIVTDWECVKITTFWPMLEVEIA